ncbi:MAG: ribonuclease H-like domain-containing protein [Candidatus Bathyarchaeota archaeon]|nr:ribonuclease H-like domain-containing protein [Candidatus Bathyarchaeota archaeon]
MVVAFDLETSGLNGYYHQIVLIGMKRHGVVEQWKIWETEDEIKMIQGCLRALEQVDPFTETIVGYNNLKFDVPFITARLEVFGKMTPETWDMLHGKKWLDLYQFLGNDCRSLTNWLHRLGIQREHEEITGKHIPELFKRKQYRKIEEHNIDDLNTSEELYNTLRMRFPDLLRA